MKTFLVRLLVTLIVLYGLGGVAYGLLHYPEGQRPEVGTIVSDFNADLLSVFHRPEAAEGPGPAAKGPAPTAPDLGSTLDRLRGGVGDELGLSMELGQILVPGSMAHLSAEASRTWGPLLPIHDKVLPETIQELGRLRTLKSTDQAAFERDREAARARLATARTTLLPHAEGPNALPAATKMLDVLERLDARLKAL